MQSLNLNPRNDANSRWVLWVLLGIIVLAAALRIYDLSKQSFWFDETIMMNIARGPFSGVMEEARGGRPPLYVVISNVWVGVFGTNEAGGRSLSALLSLLIVPSLYAVGREMFNGRVGLMAAFFAAISFFQIYYAQEVRYYSLLMLMVTLALLFYVRALRTGGWVDWLLYAVFSVLTIYAHTFGLFTLIVPSIHFVLQIMKYKSRIGRWFVSQVIIAIGILPWIIIAFGDMLGLGTPTEAAAASLSNEGWLGRVPIYAPFTTLIKFFTDEMRYIQLPFALLGVIFFVVVLLVYVFRVGLKTWINTLNQSAKTLWPNIRIQFSPLLLLVIWLILPIVTPFILSYVFSPMYLDRYVSGAAPAFYLALALIFDSVRRLIPPVAWVGLIALLLIGVFPRYYNAINKEQWNTAAAYVADHVQPGDRIVMGGYADPKTGESRNYPAYNEHLRNAFNYYYPDGKATCVGNLELDNKTFLQAAKDCAQGDFKRMWVILHGVNPQRMTDLADYVTENLPGGKLLEDIQLYNVTIYLYQVES